MPDPETGRTLHPSERLRNLIEEIELADETGLEVFGIGERVHLFSSHSHSCGSGGANQSNSAE